MPRSIAVSKVPPGPDRHFIEPALVISPERIDSHALADYILDLTGELGRLANEAGLDLLAYLLDMARTEAKQVKARTRSGAGSV